MKKTFTKALALMLALLMLTACLAGCNNNGADYDETAGFTVSLSKNADIPEDVWNAKLEEMQSWSDVPITWDITAAGDATEALSLRMAAGDYPDIILSNLLNASDVSKYAASGVLVPLDQFINEKDTPNIWKMFEENPEVKAANYLPDGKMYSLPSLVQFEPQYLERVNFINKTWLDKLGLEVPTTLDELKEVLRAFKTQDPNGNGKADEIPLTFKTNDAYSCPEGMLSTWGYATKNGVYDSFTTVKDGKVYFAPMLDEWKEMIKFYRDLYAEGLLDMEAFTHTADVFWSKMGSETSIVGMLWRQSNSMANADEYIPIGPIKAEGYDVVWHINPGIIGSRNLFSITTACKNPKAVMKWVDHFFELEHSLEVQYGEVGYALKEKNEEGVYGWNEPPAGTSLSKYISENRPVASTVRYLPGEIFGTTLELSETMLAQQENYELYKEYITDEPWPRPYYSTEDANRLAELQTDLFTLVNEKMAKWVAGTEDVESGWDKYIQDLKNMGVEELVEINQNAYNRFNKAK